MFAGNQTLGFCPVAETLSLPPHVLGWAFLDLETTRRITTPTENLAETHNAALLAPVNKTRLHKMHAQNIFFRQICCSLGNNKEAVHAWIVVKKIPVSVAGSIMLACLRG